MVEYGGLAMLVPQPIDRIEEIEFLRPGDQEEVRLTASTFCNHVMSDGPGFATGVIRGAQALR